MWTLIIFMVMYYDARPVVITVDNISSYELCVEAKNDIVENLKQSGYIRKKPASARSIKPMCVRTK